jgi:hypothetical protein
MSAPTTPNANASVPEPQGGSTAAFQQLQSKCEQLERTCQEFREKVAALEAEAQALRAERDELLRESDSYRLALQDVLRRYEPAYFPDGTVLTREEIKELRESKLTLDDVLREIEADLGHRQ